MHKFGDIRPGQTPRRDRDEETVEQLDDCLEKRAAAKAEEHCHDVKKDGKQKA